MSWIQDRSALQPQLCYWRFTLQILIRWLKETKPLKQKKHGALYGKICTFWKTCSTWSARMISVDAPKRPADGSQAPTMSSAPGPPTLSPAASARRGDTSVKGNWSRSNWYKMRSSCIVFYSKWKYTILWSYIYIYRYTYTHDIIMPTSLLFHVLPFLCARLQMGRPDQWKHWRMWSKLSKDYHLVLYEDHLQIPAKLDG